MLEQIISKFCNGSKFITNLTGLEEYLENLGLTFEEKNKVLEEVFSYNNKMYSLIVEENKKLENIINNIKVAKERKEIPIVESEKVIENQKIEILKEDVSIYLSKIKKCDKLEDLKDIISNKVAVNNFIVLRLVEEIFDIKKMLYEDRKIIDDSTRLYFENEVKKLHIKVEYIKQIINKNSKKNVVETQTNKNQLIFLKTNYGNVCVYSDLKDIPSDYYELFNILLESIENGNFKNLKLFSGDGPLVGLSEVKLNNTRIVFDNLGKNNYVILAMFIKKVDTDAAYRAYLVNRKDLYLSSKEIILESINNSEYIEENNKTKEKIYSILKKEKVKKLGDLNG